MAQQWKALFIGDLVVQRELPAQLFSPALHTLITEHALCSCNFEAPLRPSAGKTMPKIGPHLAQHPALPAQLIAAGVNLINLANNHIYDYGAQGIAETLSAFKNVTTVGAGVDFDTTYALKIMLIQGIKVGCLAYGEAQFGTLLDADLQTAGGVAWVNHPSVGDHIQRARQAVDVLLIQVHAGAEFVSLPLPEWRQRYQQLIELGADAVIGHHPHVPQGWEWYQGKPIFYSLGNAYFDMEVNKPYWNQGLAVSLQFDGAKLQAVVPLTLQKVNQQLTTVEDEAFQAYIEKLNAQLISDQYLALANQQALALWHYTYRTHYCPSWRQQLKQWLKRHLKQQDQRIPQLIHNLQIETHRFTVQRVLHLLSTLD